jgi:prophage regulatory protein
MNDEHYYSVRQVAERYDVSVATIWRWVKHGDLPAGRILSPGCTRWKGSDLQQWEQSKEAA